MIITNMRYGFTKNLGNYESCKVEIEGIPNDGQTADEVMTELKAYVAAQLPAPANGAPITPEASKSRNPRTKKANQLKVPVGIPEAIAVVATITNGNDLSLFYNTCRDDASLNQLESFPALSKAVADKCQELCEIWSPERLAISAALKAEKLKRNV